ncbi:MAG: cytochrome C, partial [Dehalococcoidia bacterium]|nr:cytochrome C [Dehalococcoidia bacterium]
MPLSRRELITGAAAGAGGLVLGGVAGGIIGNATGDEGGGGGTTGLGGNASAVIKDRSLKPDDVTRALKTFVPPGEHTDEFFLFSSGGHSGQILVIGVPSMRILKVIGVFAPEPWQGHGYGADSSDLVIKTGSDATNKALSSSRGTLTWGDTHHPALSETKGEYDGRWVYINDRANGRIAMVDLRDFKTKQIVDVPNLDSSHGGVFATPNTEYVHISTMSPTLVDRTKAANALENFAQNFRGYSTFLAIDQKTGRIDLAKSFQIELPPYTQDLADSGKLASDGWVFINSYNSEMAFGGNTEGRKPLEVGASANDYDYLHIIDWKKAEQVANAGKTKTINSMRVIPLETAVAESILYLAPEPKSPHGVDVAPNGQYLS